MKRFFLLFVALFATTFLMAQDFSQINFINDIYVKGIHSVKLNKQGYPFGFPIITLQSRQISLWFALSFQRVMISTATVW